MEVYFFKIDEKITTPQFITLNPKRCSFLVILKKKFLSNISQNWWTWINQDFIGGTFFQNHQKSTPFWILSDELGCSFFFHEYSKTTPHFVTQNHAKNHIFNMSVPNNYTSFRHSKSRWKSHFYHFHPKKYTPFLS